MAAPPIERALEFGFRSEPKPEDAVGYYLPRLLAGERMHATIAPFIHTTDIYASEPGALAAQFRPTPRAGDRFFFTSCKRQPQKSGETGRGVRAAGPGHWHSQGHTTDVLDDAGAKIGEARKFRYKKGGAFTEWLMDEFSSRAANTFVGDKQFMLCKIYVSPRAGPDSAGRQESAAFIAFAQPPPPPPEEQVPVFAAPNYNKRPAPPVAEPPRPTKRAAVLIPIPPAPVVQEPCSPVASRDPFCTETEPPAAADQEDDRLGFTFDIDVAFAQADEGNPWAQQAVEPDSDAAIFAPTPTPEEPVLAAAPNSKSTQAAADPIPTHSVVQPPSPIPHCPCKNQHRVTSSSPRWQRQQLAHGHGSHQVEIPSARIQRRKQRRRRRKMTPITTGFRHSVSLETSRAATVERGEKGDS